MTAPEGGGFFNGEVPPLARREARRLARWSIVRGEFLARVRTCVSRRRSTPTPANETTRDAAQ